MGSAEGSTEGKAEGGHRLGAVTTACPPRGAGGQHLEGPQSSRSTFPAAG